MFFTFCLAPNAADSATAPPCEKPPTTMRSLGTP